MEGSGVKQKIGKTTGAVAKGALAVALVATLSPTAALSAPSEAQAQTRQSAYAASSNGASYDLSRIVDGTYNGSATVKDIEDDFSDWTLKVAVTVSNHKITNVQITNTSYGSKSKNKTKTTKAANTIIPQIVSNNSTSGIDTVSGATCSSKALKEAVNNALANAKTAEPVVKTSLASAIEAARAVEQGSKTDEAFAALASAVEAAQAVNSNASATQGQVDAAVAAPGAGESFSPYTLTARVTVKDHKITKVKATGAKGKANKYLNRAANGKSGVAAQIVRGNSTDGVVAVPAAPGSSAAIVAAVDDALANA